MHISIPLFDWLTISRGGNYVSMQQNNNCANCGQQFLPNAKFCSGCGRSRDTNPIGQPIQQQPQVVYIEQQGPDMITCSECHCNNVAIHKCYECHRELCLVHTTMVHRNHHDHPYCH